VKDKEKEPEMDETSPDGYRTESDTVEMSPEFADMMDDEAIAFCKENNPELLEIMKIAGLQIDAD
jgi:hypothetical protein